ncbi:MAG: hypothetical protein LAT63_07075 [Marinobacter sp.]|nr:hypothetical protein [Marinobacter sp.]
MPLLRKLAVLACLLPALSQAQPASIHNYSYLELSLQHLVLFEPVRLQAVDEVLERYESLSGFGLRGSWQFHRLGFMYLQAQGLFNEGDDTRWEDGLAQLGFGLAYPMVMGVDLVLTLGGVVRRESTCSLDDCVDVESDGYSMGGGLRLELGNYADLQIHYDRLALSATWPDGSKERDMSNRVSAEFLLGSRHHGAILGITTVDDDNIFKLGYRYSF